VSEPHPDIELNRTTIHAALAAVREGRSSGNPTLDHVADALNRSRARVWARLRKGRPDFTAAEIDFMADRTVDVLASEPRLVLAILFADAIQRAGAGGAS
jgi:hypothetical protein